MQKISTFILSEEFSTSQVLKLFVGEFDNLDIVETSDSSFIYDKISNIQGKSILIVDVSSNKKQKLDLILKVTRECKNCKVLVLSDSPSVDLIIEIMRAGAKEFVPIPIIKAEFCEALNKLIEQADEQKTTSKCKIISVFSNGRYYNIFGFKTII